MASPDFSAPHVSHAAPTPAGVDATPLKPWAVRAKLILGVAVAAFAVAAIAHSLRGGTSGTATANLGTLSARLGCLAVTNTGHLGFVQSGTCWFTPLPDHPITSEEILQHSASTQAKLDAMKAVDLTVYTGGLGDMSAEEITNEKFQALVNSPESCDGPTYYVHGSNWFTDGISDAELAQHIAATSHGEFGSRQCGVRPG